MDLIIPVPLIRQREDTPTPEWVAQTCSICALKMLMLTKKPELQDVSIMSLVEKGLAIDGFIENIGWKHRALVELAKGFDLNLIMTEKFYYSPEEKERGMGIINSHLDQQNPVIVNIIKFKDNPSKTGHVVIINGYCKEDDQVVGYHIQDPDPEDLGTNYFVTIDKFLPHWRGGLLYLVA